MKRRHDLIFDLPMSVSFGQNSEIENVNEQYSITLLLVISSFLLSACFTV